MRLSEPRRFYLPLRSAIIQQSTTAGIKVLGQCVAVARGRIVGKYKGRQKATFPPNKASASVGFVTQDSSRFTRNIKREPLLNKNKNK